MRTADTPAITDSTLMLPGHGAMPMRIQGRGKSSPPGPLVLHLHGGAFTGGDIESGQCLAQLLAEAGATVLSVSYPLAPQQPFPQAVEACYAALTWMQRNGGRLAGPRAPLFVAGEEAGANIATGVAMMARDRAEPELAGLMLVAPMLDPCTATASQREAAGDCVECKWSEGWRAYLQRPMDAEHPYAVPAHAQRLAGLPPTLILAGEDDPMRDEAMAFAQRLRQAAIPVRTGLIPATGWPESLEDAPGSCPCEAAVRSQFEDFFAEPHPPPA